MKEQKGEGDTQRSQEYKPYDVERIDWAQFEKLGVKKETLEKSGALNEMLSYRKSPNLIDISPQIGDATIRTQARLSMRETEDGRVVPVIHALRKEPQLSRPFYGHIFTDEDKTNLQQTGNLGRVVELTNRNTGEITPSLISVDKQTNELVAYRADRIRIPNDIKGVSLDDIQKQELSDGKAVYIEGMTAKSGKEFSAYVQFNADKRGLEFRFDGEQKQGAEQQMRIPTKLGSVELSDKEQATLKEGGTIYVEGLKDKAGKEYNAYVKVDPDEKRLNFFKWNPDKEQHKQEQTQPKDDLQQQKSRPKGVRM